MPQANLYFDDTYLTSHRSSVLEAGTDDQGAWVALAENIAHPQGGGQPSDRVTLNGARAAPFFAPDGFAADAPVRLRISDGDAAALAAGAIVQIEIDAALRRHHAALHTAGHLLHWVVQGLGWQAVKGNHFPGESRVEFRPAEPTPPPWDSIAQEVAQRCEALLASAPGVSAWMDDATRLTRIDGTEDVPCAGTHVDHLGRIAQFTILSGKVKKGLLKLRYDAAHAAP